MKKGIRDYIHYLEDILSSIVKVQTYVKKLSFSDFTEDEKTVDAVIRNFEIIGEASKNIPVAIKNKYSNVPWEEMYRLRNKAMHEYFGIDYEIIWEIISKHLPRNQKDIEIILKAEKEKYRKP